VNATEKIEIALIEFVSECPLVNASCCNVLYALDVGMVASCT